MVISGFLSIFTDKTNNNMGLEIERKFLILNDGYKAGVQGVEYRQGYLSTDIDRTVRVRTAGDKGFVTIKGRTQGYCREEFEYEIPFGEACRLLDRLCIKPLIEKVRYRRAESDGKIWEIDEFRGVNAGLVLAEIELQSEDESFGRPSWLGNEVSDDPRYCNSYLATHPYSEWE